MNINLEAICHQAIVVIKNVGSFIHEENQKLNKEKIQYKGQNDLVTYVDTTSEQRLIAGLQKLVPQAGFIAEENSIAQTKGDWQWVIDPLDGTTNYVHGLPFYSISVALMHRQSVVLGIVYEIALQECFYTWQNGKAYLNGSEIHVSTVPSLATSLLATGFPYSNTSRLDPYVDLFKHLLKNSQGMRRLGSAAADLAYVACGRFEGFYEYNLKPWDVAAGSLLVQQAGGQVGDFHGGNNYIFGQEIVAANPQVYPELLQAVGRFF